MKKPKINQIIEEKVLKELTQGFQENGFQYKKGIKGFVKRQNEIEYEVSIDNTYDIYMDQRIDGPYDLYLTFKVSFETNLPEFEKWYINEFGRGDFAYISLFSTALEFCIPLNEGIDFKMPDDFDKNQQTYIGESMHLVKKTTNNAYMFSSFGHEEVIDDFNANTYKVFSTLKELLNKEYDYKNLALNNRWFKYKALLIFLNELEIPTEFIINRTNELISKLESKKIDLEEKFEINDTLEYFITIGRKYLGLTLNNPFKEKYRVGIRCLENQSESISIGTNINYREKLRIDFNKIKKTIGYALNSDGDLLIYVNFENSQKENKIYLINKDASIVAEKEIPVTITFGNIGNIKNTPDFYLQKYLIDGKNGEIKELNYKEKKEFRLMNMVLYEDNLIATSLYKIFIFKDNEIIKQIKTPRNTEIIYHDLKNKLFYSKNKKARIFQINYSGDIQKEYVVARDGLEVFIRDNFIYSFGVLSHKLQQTDISTGIKKTIQKSTLYPNPNAVLNFDENTNIIFKNTGKFGAQMELYNQDFSTKIESFSIDKKNLFISFQTSQFFIQRDEDNKHLIIYEKTTANH